MIFAVGQSGEWKKCSSAITARPFGWATACRGKEKIEDDREMSSSAIVSHATKNPPDPGGFM
jgi:hypothetical protein